MRMLNQNKRNLYYSLQTEEVPIYETDDDGNIIYITVDGVSVPVETGETELGYSNPVPFKGNISMSSGGESQPVEYGIDISAYDAVLVMQKDAIPVTETSLIWFESEPRFKDVNKTIVEPKSADYKVLSVKPSLNEDKYILGHLVK